VRGVIFDLDGTLFDADYDWPAIKRRLGVERADGSILEHLASLPPGDRERKEEDLRRIERQATDSGTLKPGVRELLESIVARGRFVALVTNNTRSNADRVLDRYDLRFDRVLTRDSGMFKPSGAPLLDVARSWNVEPRDLAAVGDNELDLRAARDAGIGVVIIVNTDVARFAGRCDHAVPGIDRVRPILDRLP
jgi:HAD superfamily hydrolase (TIGR01509 family)